MNNRIFIKLVLSLILFSVSSTFVQAGNPDLPVFVSFAKPGYLAVKNISSSEETDNHWGMIDYQGNVAYDGVSKWLEIYDDGDGFSITFSNKYGFSVFGELGEKGVRYGLTNNDNVIVLQPTFNNILLLDEVCYAEDSKSGEASVILLPSLTVVGKFVPKFSTQDVRYISDGTIVIEKDDKYSVYDFKGNELISPKRLKKYSAVYGFHEGLAAVTSKKDKSIGYINEKGEEVIKPQFEFDFGNGSKCLHGEESINFTNGRVILYNHKEKAGAIDKNGNVVIPFIYEDISPFQNGKAVARYEDESSLYNCGEKWIDLNGNDTTPHEVTADSPDLQSVYDEKTGLCGYQNKDSVMVIPPIYKIASDFVDGHALVLKDGQVCLIDTTGRIILSNLGTSIECF